MCCGGFGVLLYISQIIHLYSFYIQLHKSVMYYINTKHNYTPIYALYYINIE